MICVSVSPFKTMYLKLPNICQSRAAARAPRSRNFPCNVFRETLASAALNCDPICFQQRLLLVDILAILHLTRELHVFWCTPSFQTKLHGEFKLKQPVWS